jgi:hypothetical protein
MITVTRITTPDGLTTTGRQCTLEGFGTEGAGVEVGTVEAGMAAGAGMEVEVGMVAEAGTEVVVGAGMVAEAGISNRSLLRIAN